MPRTSEFAVVRIRSGEAYEKFVNIVADGRDMSVEDVKKLSDRKNILQSR